MSLILIRLRENKIWILKCFYNFILILVIFNKFRIDWFFWVFLFFIYLKNIFVIFFYFKKSKYLINLIYKI